MILSSPIAAVGCFSWVQEPSVLAGPPHLSPTAEQEATYEALEQQQQWPCSWQTCLNQLLSGRKATVWLTVWVASRQQLRLTFCPAPSHLRIVSDLCYGEDKLGVKCFCLLNTFSHNVMHSQNKWLWEWTHSSFYWSVLLPYKRKGLSVMSLHKSFKFLHDHFHIFTWNYYVILRKFHVLTW